MKEQKEIKRLFCNVTTDHAKGSLTVRTRRIQTRKKNLDIETSDKNMDIITSYLLNSKSNIDPKEAPSDYGWINIKTPTKVQPEPEEPRRVQTAVSSSRRDKIIAAVIPIPQLSESKSTITKVIEPNKIELKSKPVVRTVSTKLKPKRKKNKSSSSSSSNSSSSSKSST